jgi:hypothetical protein
MPCQETLELIMTFKSPPGRLKRTGGQTILITCRGFHQGNQAIDSRRSGRSICCCTDHAGEH